MIWVYVLAYDIWEFQYTYLNLPTHSLVLRSCRILLAPDLRSSPLEQRRLIQNQKPTRWHSGACSRRYFHCFRMRRPFHNSHFRIRTGHHPAAMGSSMPTIAEPDYTGIISRTVLCSECIRLRIHFEARKSTEKEPGRTRSSQMQRLQRSNGRA